MNGDYIRVTTHSDLKFLDVARKDAPTVDHLKERLQTDLGIPYETIRILYAGKELQNHQPVEMIDRVYACIVPQTCIHNPRLSKRPSRSYGGMTGGADTRGSITNVYSTLFSSCNHPSTASVTTKIQSV